MKVVATISVNVKVKESDHPSDVHERVIEKLAKVCEGWLEGDVCPKITINYSMDKDDVESIKDLLN
jgi:uncharacterized protein involved in high-affinity Fe2+ transport|tara:strand:- start:527 stop:724 length:198 start_codon:yes stop_codon:yes gene_type:complete